MSSTWNLVASSGGEATTMSRSSLRRRCTQTGRSPAPGGRGSTDRRGGAAGRTASGSPPRAPAPPGRLRPEQHRGDGTARSSHEPRRARRLGARRPGPGSLPSQRSCRPGRAWPPPGSTWQPMAQVHLDPRLEAIVFGHGRALVKPGDEGTRHHRRIHHRSGDPHRWAHAEDQGHAHPGDLPASHRMVRVLPVADIPGGEFPSAGARNRLQATELRIGGSTGVVERNGHPVSQLRTRCKERVAGPSQPRCPRTPAVGRVRPPERHRTHSPEGPA